MNRTWSLVVLTLVTSVVVGSGGGSTGFAASSTATEVRSIPHPDAEVFLKVHVTAAETAAVRRLVRRSPVVRTFAYLSKRDALREFRKLFRNDPKLLAQTTADQLPASFPVTLTTAGAVSSFRRAMSGVAGVDEVKSSDAKSDAKAFDDQLGRVCDWREQHPDAGDVEVFLTMDVTESQTDSVQTLLLQSPLVRSFDFVSHRHALRIFREQFADKPKLLRSTRAEDLPTSFRVRLAPATVPGPLIEQLTPVPGVDEVVERPTAAACYATFGQSA